MSGLGKERRPLGMPKYILRAKTVILSVVAVQECNQAGDFCCI